MDPIHFLIDLNVRCSELGTLEDDVEYGGREGEMYNLDQTLNPDISEGGASDSDKCLAAISGSWGLEDLLKISLLTPKNWL